VATAADSYSVNANTIPKLGAQPTKEEIERVRELAANQAAEQEKAREVRRKAREAECEKTAREPLGFMQMTGTAVSTAHGVLDPCTLMPGMYVHLTKGAVMSSYVYRALVVDSRTHEIFESDPFVASGEDHARTKAFILSKHEVDEYEFYDIILERVGSVRNKSMVKDEDE
jgi:hypothetical protein